MFITWSRIHMKIFRVSGSKLTKIFQLDRRWVRTMCRVMLVSNLRWRKLRDSEFVQLRSPPKAANRRARHNLDSLRLKCSPTWNESLCAGSDNWIQPKYHWGGFLIIFVCNSLSNPTFHLGVWSWLFYQRFLAVTATRQLQISTTRHDLAYAVFLRHRHKYSLLCWLLCFDLLQWHDHENKI